MGGLAHAVARFSSGSSVLLWVETGDVSVMGDVGAYCQIDYRSPTDGQTYYYTIALDQEGSIIPFPGGPQNADECAKSVNLPGGHGAPAPGHEHLLDLDLWALARDETRPPRTARAVGPGRALPSLTGWLNPRSPRTTLRTASEVAIGVLFRSAKLNARPGRANVPPDSHSGEHRRPTARPGTATSRRRLGA